MSDDLVKRLRATTDGATVNPDGPEAADRIAALEAAVTQCRTLSAMLKPQADRIAELESALRNIEADCCSDCPPSHGAIKYACRDALEGGKKDG